MLKKIFIVVCCALCAYNCYAQDVPEKTKMFSHYAGVQANELFRQIINLNNTNDIVDNPYLLVYSLNLANSGWGVNAGIGYNYKKTADKDAPGNRINKMNDLFYRAGLGRKVMISKKLMAGYGLDFAGDYQLNKTTSVSVTDFGSSSDSSITSVTSKIESAGGGVQLNLGFHISERLILSTEATYYFLKSKQKQNILVTETVTNINNNDSATTTANENIETEISDFTFRIPVAIFLVVKF